MQTEQSLVLRNSVPRPGQRFPLKQPAYMTNNWRMLLGLIDSEDPYSQKIRYVRVKDKIATLSQKDLLFRTPLQLPDGFYEISSEADLIFVDVCVDAVKSPFTSAAVASENLPREAIHNLLNWTVWRNQQSPDGKSASLLVDEQGLIDESSPSERFQFRSRSTPGTMVRLPIPGEPISLNAFHLRLALTEATRYDTVVIAYERQLDQITPLLIGSDWSHCAVVMPKPTYLRHTRLNG